MGCLLQWRQRRGSSGGNHSPRGLAVRRMGEQSGDWSWSSLRFYKFSVPSPWVAHCGLFFYIFSRFIKQLDLPSVYRFFNTDDSTWIFPFLTVMYRE